MSLVAVGLNHRTAPLPLLERSACPSEDLGKALAGLSVRDNLSEVVMISTCMRTEVYAVAERFHGAVSDILDFLSVGAGVEPDDLSEHTYSFYDAACVTHLFRVAAGLDSAVLGEGEILGQVRDAWERARAEGTAGPGLNALFRHAVEVGKRARAETAIARGITSVPQAGVALASRVLGVRALDLRARGEEVPSPNVVVVGAGAIGGVVASAVASSWQPQRIVVASRAAESAETLCARLGEEGFAGSVPAVLDGLALYLSDADVVFTATSSPEPVVRAEEVRAVLTGRSQRPLVVVDLAVPRDVEAAVGEVAGVTLFDMDSIREFVAGEMSDREAEVERVAEIIEEELARFLDHASARQVVPLVTSLRERAEAIRETELARYGKRLSALDAAQLSAVDALTKAIVAKLLHEPTVRLKTASGTPRGERLSEALRDLFDL